mgnify:FL=1
MKKKFLALSLALALGLGLTACTSGSSSSTSGSSASGSDTSSSQSSSSTEDKKTIVFGTSADYPPFEFHILDENGKDQIVGIDVAVAQKIANDMGCELQIKDMSFENLLANLGRGDVDFVIAAMELDAEGTRANAADYSDPYYTDEAPLVVVKKENADQYTSLDSFNGKSVGAQTATTKADLSS